MIYLCLKVVSCYSYFKALIGSSFAALSAGKIETITVIKIELNEYLSYQRQDQNNWDHQLQEEIDM